ncbi:MAG TPA: hypothetical protein VIV15_09705, partial [Anaerolineales bacterium]
MLELPAATTPSIETAPVSAPLENTATPTIDWFPMTPTASPAPYATNTATPEMRPGIGQTTLSDSFSDEELWDTAVSDKGSASI